MMIEKHQKKNKPLGSDAKIHKRPLHHHAIVSPYAGVSHPKVVYIKPSTPFMSAVNRVRKLLRQVDVRAQQRIQTKSKKIQGDKILAQARMGLSEASQEIITVKGSGRAVEKVLQIATWFGDRQKEEGVQVNLSTSSVIAIDDVEYDNDNSPDTQRFRQVSVLEAKISLR